MGCGLRRQGWETTPQDRYGGVFRWVGTGPCCWPKEPVTHLCCRGYQPCHLDELFRVPAHSGNAGAYASAGDFANYDAVTHARSLAGIPVQVASGDSDPFHLGFNPLRKFCHLPLSSTSQRVATQAPSSSSGSTSVIVLLGSSPRNVRSLRIQALLIRLGSRVKWVTLGSTKPGSCFLG